MNDTTSDTATSEPTSGTDSIAALERAYGDLAAVVAALCVRLRETVEHVTLNVKADNTAAVRLYERVGFSRVADYDECVLTAR